MILISHRGNISGKNPESENSPEYIVEAIELGYSVEIDLWLIDDTYFLGHDFPQYKININWILQRKLFLWIHCKNINAIEEIKKNSKQIIYEGINYFFHDKDDVTITSKGYLWVYPGKQPVKNSIAVLPEIFEDDLSHCIGICSDNIGKYISSRDLLD